jgi:hypothetical protein
MGQVKKEAGNEWLARMRNLYSFAAVLDTAGVVAMGPNVAHVSASEAFLVSGQGMLLLGLTLLELRAEAVLDVVCSFLQHVLHFNVVALFRAATLETLVKRLVGGDVARGEFVAPRVWRSVKGGSGDDTAIGVYGAEEEGGGWLVMDEGFNYLILIEEETT